MTSYVFYPVTGDGQTKATQFIWNAGLVNWNTNADWVQGSTLVFQNPALDPGAVPGGGGGSGAGASQGPGNDDVGLVAGDVTSFALAAYQPNPSKGDPYIGSDSFPVDMLINSGTVDIHNLLLAAFNQYSFGDVEQFPTLDVEGATLEVTGSIANAAMVLFPTVTNVPVLGTIGGLLDATGGGTIDIGAGGTVQIAGSVQAQVTLHFNDASDDQLTLSGVSAAAPTAFAGTVDNFVAGDTIFLPGLTSPGSDTTAFNNGTLTISNGTTTLATLAMTGGATSGFSLTSVNGGTDLTIGAGVTASATATLVANAYLGIERVAIPGGVTGSTATSVAAAITAGQQTLAGYESSLVGLDQTLYTTLPALVTIDAYYGATPQPATLDAVAAATGSPSTTGGFYSGQYLHSLGYSDPNVWTIMASQWGADQNSTFYKQYNGFGTDYQDFIATVYQREFGFAPSSANLQTLVNDVPGVQALLSGGGAAPTPIQVVSGIYGYLLYVGQTTPSLPTQYAASANAFLTAAANGTVTYGPELTQEFPSGATTASVTSAAKTASDPSIITVSGLDQLVDPGAGSFAIQFLPTASNDTLVLHSGGTDVVSGFDPSSDVLDLRALAAGTGLGLNGNLSALSSYLSVSDQNGNAALQFSPTGNGGGSTVAVLQGLGGTSLTTLMAQGAIRLT